MSLSIVILSYNVKVLLRNAIKAVDNTYKSPDVQIIVVDNASTDGSVSMIKKEFPKVELIVSNTNTGFSAGNNLAKKMTKGDVVLFLNPDTEVGKDAIKKCMQILMEKQELGAITCKVMLPNGKMDYSCHRGLPTPWNSLCYFSGLSKLFPKNPFFAGYEASYLDTRESHYIDCASGTFLMVKREALDKIGWWDSDYWWNGDDVEFCYKLKTSGYKIWYEASVTMMHYKGSSSGLWKTGKVKVSKEVQKRSALSASKAMRIFTNKHWKELGPWPVMMFVRLGIVLLEKYRVMLINQGRSYKS
jgi:GT2 family glycosyltransferase